MPPNTRTFSATLRRLHFLVAGLVPAQIVIGLIMNPRATPTLFTAHQFVGLTIAAIVLVHWFWLIAFQRDQLACFIPLSDATLRPVGQDVAGLLHGLMPSGGPRAGLPALVHGLGLLALTVVAALGTTIFVLIQVQRDDSPILRTVAEFHVFFAWVVIVYWVGHVLLALTHEARGDHVIARMFRAGK